MWFDYAHLASVTNGTCVDSAGQPVPWYTYPAIEYLKQLDVRDRTVFEYGSGSSTLFWAARAARVVSVEDDEGWFTKLRSRVPANCELIFEPDLRAYARTIERYPEGFDIIVVDGAARGGTRLRCSQHALPMLRPGGMIILDNSDWLPESARLFRDADLIEVDMTGFVPIFGHSQTTSFFLHREFRARPGDSRHPLPGPGALRNAWEHPRPAQGVTLEIDGEWFGGVERDEPFTINSGGKSRRFRLVVARLTVSGSCAAIIDDDQGRVLISLTEPSPGESSVETELARAVGLTWNEFGDFINRHDKKRYPLAS